MHDVAFSLLVCHRDKKSNLAFQAFLVSERCVGEDEKPGGRNIERHELETGLRGSSEVFGELPQGLEICSCGWVGACGNELHGRANAWTRADAFVLGYSALACKCFLVLGIL